MKKEINPVLRRLSDWAESKGGFAEVGRRIQKHPSMFYNLIRRDALPSLATLTEIAKEFPDLDLNFIIRGVHSVQQKELNELKEQLQVKEATIVKLVMPSVSAKAKGAIFCPGRDKQFRFEGAKQMQRNVRSSVSKKRMSLPVRVHGTEVDVLMAQAYQALNR